MITTPQIERRRKYLFEFVDVSKLKGLEIGPYDRPIMIKSHGTIKYMDYLSSEELKKKQASGRNIDEIVELDYVIKEQEISNVINDNFDYIVASHVIEHIPNLIHWLNELSKILSKNGKIFLAIPDKRYTFDICRPVTTTGSIIEDFLINKKKPSFENVFDALRNHKKFFAHDAWFKDTDINELKFTHGLHQSYALAQKAINEYYDCHCNVFTFDSFINIVEDLKSLKIINYQIKKIIDVEKGFNDFICILEKI